MYGRNLIGSNLKKLRKLSNISQEEFVAKLSLIGFELDRTSLSRIENQNREVYDYECRGIRLETNESGCTKEDIKQFLKECPEHRMW